MSIKSIIYQLNHSDERSNLGAKKGTSIDRSILETVCAFSNEPDLGGGCIVLGVEVSDDTLFPSYQIIGVDNPDKSQKDLATQCADLFNIPVRPKITVEEINSKVVLLINVSELPREQKPLFFKKQGLPLFQDNIKSRGMHQETKTLCIFGRFYAKKIITYHL